METSFKLKRVKGIMTEMIPEPKNISYENDLLGIECGLTALQAGRLIPNTSVLILNVYEDIDEYYLSKLKKNSKTRGHCVALVTEQCKLDMTKYFFTENTN